MERLEEVIGEFVVSRDSDGRVTIRRNGSAEAIELIPQVGDEKLIWLKTLFYGESSAGGAIISRKALRAALKMLQKGDVSVGKSEMSGELRQSLHICQFFISEYPNGRKDLCLATKKGDNISPCGVRTFEDLGKCGNYVVLKDRHP